ncbi:MAG: alpha/beta fold hydrolase [Wenzhouxiangellaceae bacterium]
MTTKPAKQRWFRKFPSTKAPRVTLYCFPYGGSGPSIFREWSDQLGDDIEVVGVLYPGRESRVLEPLLPDIVEIARAMAASVVPDLRQPFAFYGHSMGALISYELARILGAEHGLMPRHLFVSGAGAPHVPTEEPIHHLPDEEFLQALIDLNGMPQAVLDNRSLLEYALPIIRNDFKACAEYRYLDGPSVTCPLTAMGGTDDPRVREEHVTLWNEYTPAAFQARIFPGDHFFLGPQEAAILKLIQQELAENTTEAVVGSQ